MACGRACRRVFWITSMLRALISFVCKKLSCRKGRLSSNWMDMNSIGIMPRKKAIPEQRFSRHKPIGVKYGMGIPEMDTEGRLITLEFEDFYLVTCYTPNAQRELARLDFRLEWEKHFSQYLLDLDSIKPVVVCGDLNVAHQEIDLKNPKANRGSAGFSDEERACFTSLLDCGFTDTFRFLYPDTTGVYSWWSYMFKARQNNAGWRIDYFLVSNRLQGKISEASIHTDILGSDHCPVSLELR